MTSMTAPAPQQPPPTPDQVRTAIREAVQSSIEATQQGGAAAQAGATAPVRAPREVISAIEGQIAAERANMTRIGEQIAQARSSGARASLGQELEASGERLQALQGQLDRALGLPAASPQVVIPPFPNDVPNGVQEIIGGFFFMIVAVAIGGPLARAYARRLDRRALPAAAPAALPDLEARLDRIDQALDAIAIEVERISENQRFVSKSMQDLRALPAPNPLAQWPLPTTPAREVVERAGDGQ